jgi:hypothetical protein
MPFPIWPAPTTPTVEISTIRPSKDDFVRARALTVEARLLNR